MTDKKNNSTSTSTEKLGDEIKRKEKSSSSKKDKTKPLTKVVVRKLPPTMTEEQFLKQIDPIPDYDSYYFVPADWSLGQHSTSRAYINFLNHDDIYLFKDRFDGYIFVDSLKGTEYSACVEFAPFQGLTKIKTKKSDPKCNTIETDPHYINYLEKLNNELNEIGAMKTDFKLELSYQSKNDKKAISTPLLQYLANKKQERKDERKQRIEQKRRQRDEERKKKRMQVIKNIPSAIKEEESKNNKKDRDKNIYDRKDRDKDRSMTNDENKKEQRRDKRRLEREQRRKQQREKEQDQYERNKKLQDQQKPSSSSSSSSNNNLKKDDVENSKALNIMVKGSSNNSNVTNKNPISKETTEKKNPNLNENSNSNRSSSSTSSNNTCKIECDQDNNNASKDSSIEQKKPKSTDDETTSKGSSKGLDEINENVKEFFMNAACLTKNTPKKSSLVSHKNEKQATPSTSATTMLRTGSSDDRNKKSEYKNESKKEDKAARRIRNKDRPSIEIYQPGKMRLNSKRDDNRGSSGSSGNESKEYKSNDNYVMKQDSSKDDSDTTVRKKVTRYSERRVNRAKEKEQKIGSKTEIKDEKSNQSEETKIDFT